MHTAKPAASITIAVPANAAAITPAWMSSALRAGGLDVEVTDVQTRIITQSVGMTGAFIHCTLFYAGSCDGKPGAGPTSVVAKMLGELPGSSSHSSAMGLWEREIRFYREIAPHFDSRIPRCYFAQSDIERGTHILLLEDLTGCRQPRYVSTNEARIAVRWLAATHARWFGRVERELPWLQREQDFERQLRGSIEQHWAEFLTKAEGYVPTHQVAMVEQCVASFGEGLTGTALLPTLLHYDYRIGNMMFDAAAELIVFDWQSPLRGQGTSDLCWFVADSIEPALRAQAHAELPNLYREELLRCGIPSAELAVLDSQYRRSRLRRVPLSVLTATLWLPLAHQDGKPTWANDYDELEQIWRSLQHA